MILLVEDDQSNSELLEIVLQKLGHTSISVDSGEKAVIMMDGDRIDRFACVLMDVKLRGIDGYETTRRLRAAGVTAPIIACTAMAMAGDREKCRASGMNDYMSKPITVDTMKAMLETWL